MIEIDCRQGSSEWLAARMGIPTASAFKRIVSPKKLQPSEQAERYLWEKVAERITGELQETFEGTYDTDRGGDLEAEAVAFYELKHGAETRKAGFCLTDDRRYGCSPDRFVVGGGLLEVKCPKAWKHLSLLAGDGLDEYRLQHQGELLVTGEPWVDLLSYFPGLPDAEYRFTADGEVFGKLSPALDDFCARLNAAEARIRAMLGERVAA